MDRYGIGQSCALYLSFGRLSILVHVLQRYVQANPVACALIAVAGSIGNEKLPITPGPRLRAIRPYAKPLRGSGAHITLAEIGARANAS